MSLQVKSQWPWFTNNFTCLFCNSFHQNWAHKPSLPLIHPLISTSSHSLITQISAVMYILWAIHSERRERKRNRVFHGWLGCYGNKKWSLFSQKSVLVPSVSLKTPHFSLSFSFPSVFSPSAPSLAFFSLPHVLALFLSASLSFRPVLSCLSYLSHSPSLSDHLSL